MAYYDLRLRAYLPNGATVGVLPYPDDVNLSVPRSDIGALTFSYARTAARFGLLQQPLEVAVEAYSVENGVFIEPVGCRFMYLRDEGDDTKREPLKVTAQAWMKRLDKVLVGYDTVAMAQGYTSPANVTAGKVLRDLMERAQARGAMTGMTLAFNGAGANEDSAGRPFPVVSADPLTYEANRSLLSIVQEMAARGWIDYGTSSRSVLIYGYGATGDEAGRAGTDWTTTIGTNWRLQRGRDLVEAPFRRTWEGIAGRVVAYGVGTAIQVDAPDAAADPWGREEIAVVASNVSDPIALQKIAANTLALSRGSRTERTYGLAFGKSSLRPLLNYTPGDKIWGPDGTAVGALRVQQITLTKTMADGVGGNVILGDRFTDADVQLQREVQFLLDTSGA